MRLRRQTSPCSGTGVSTAWSRWSPSRTLGLVPTVAVPGLGCPVAGHLSAAGPLDGRRNGYEGGPAALGCQGRASVGRIRPRARGLCTWVSAFLVWEGLVLVRKPCAAKGNEIIAIPRLLECMHDRCRRLPESCRVGPVARGCRCWPLSGAPCMRRGRGLRRLSPQRHGQEGLWAH